MQELPHDLFTLFVLAFAFGVKHGLDPDHLATIDGLSRFNAASKPWLAKWAGVFFSLGHGLMITTVVAVLALLPGQITVPVWLEGFGAAVSTLTLLLLGILNLYAAFNYHGDQTRPVGLKSWMRFQSGHPAIVLGIGALFALSFDTMSQAAFFSLTTARISGEFYAFALGAVFTIGMIVSDGLNGMLTTRFIQQSARRAQSASRVMSFAIGSASLLVALMGISRLLFPALSQQIERYGIWPGMAVLAWVASGFVLSLYIARSTGLSRKTGARQ